MNNCRVDLTCQDRQSLIHQPICALCLLWLLVDDKNNPFLVKAKWSWSLGSCFTFNFLTYFSLSILWALLYGLNVTTIVPLRSFLEILCTLAEMCLLHYDDSNLITIRRMDWSVLYAVCVYYSTLHLEKSHSWKKKGFLDTCWQILLILIPALLTDQSQITGDFYPAIFLGKSLWTENTLPCNRLSAH